MKGLPVTIRLLDPPLHEFLPHDDEGARQELAKQLGHLAPEQVKARVSQLHEANPMLGHRGCRLAITYPEILEMQVPAIIEAAIDCKKEGIKALAGDHDPAGRHGEGACSTASRSPTRSRRP